ncbi:MAG TPA: hypothetical protein VF444_02710 [Pseudonocardiaceae bacterium]
MLTAVSLTPNISSPILAYYRGWSHQTISWTISAATVPTIQLILMLVGGILLFGRKRVGRFLVIIPIIIEIIGVILGLLHVRALYDFFFLDYPVNFHFIPLPSWMFMELVTTVLALLPMSARRRPAANQPPLPPAPPAGYPVQQPFYPQQQQGYPYPQQRPPAGR